jgi:hypothetical protein
MISIIAGWIADPARTLISAAFVAELALNKQTVARTNRRDNVTIPGWVDDT